MDHSQYFASSTGKVTNFATDTGGKLIVSSLDIGDYYFEKIKSFSGHMPYGNKIEFTISADSDATLNIDVTVSNNSIVMYETGGNGTDTILFTGFSMFAFRLQ